MTKIAKILKKNRLTQRDLQRMILVKYGVFIGDDRISRLVKGKHINMTLKTAVMVADTLKVSIDDIIERKLLFPKP